eukprot:CAMPEP_0197841010 /NCGR_PEP_ID=MMETSP1437-20131217/45931_1 /TAXON_ID=49252 ORGANISM="Eucampia antarctica, Strain CCMP1452" /NCGR_SAMPLE_ID=MMETSP1437 /ASSEMBLY_ACC=CAM_ASM_001096 /LENGTH=339 /DNA_ID=CAMNT_0043450703 /DNA_START=67 /DNA_END=1086 /DNA_ORIENTATION=-
MKYISPSSAFFFYVTVATLLGTNNNVTFQAHAYPNGAGTCETGAAIGTASGGNHGPNGLGSLADAGLEVKVGSEVLDTGTTKEFMTEIEHNVGLEFTGSSGSGFKGFLFRLSSTNNTDASAGLKILSSDDSQKLPSTGERGKNAESNSACANTVAGITHITNNIKQSVSTTLKMEEATNLDLEITVVVSNPPKNKWYYSKYTIKMVAPPTSYPSSQPSMIPSTMPSDAPTSMVAPPTSYPSSQPSMIPSTMPSDAPTSMPSVAPSGIPSATPSSAPSMTPSISMIPSVSSAPSGIPSVTSTASKEPVVTPTPTEKSASVGYISHGTISCICLIGVMFLL